MDCERVREPRFSVVTCMFYERSDTAGRVGLVGLSLFAAIEERTIERIWFDSRQARCSDQTCRLGSARTNRKSGTTRCRAQEDDVESHQGHARYRQRLDGHDSQRMLERCQRDGSTRRLCSSTMGTLTSSTQSCQCSRSLIHHTARFGLPRWCDQPFKKPLSILFFVALDTSLCNAGQAIAFRVPFWWAYSGCCVPRSYYTARVTHIASVMWRIQISRHSTPDARHVHSAKYVPQKSVRPHDTPHQFWFRCVCGHR